MICDRRSDSASVRWCVVFLTFSLLRKTADDIPSAAPATQRRPGNHEQLHMLRRRCAFRAQSKVMTWG